jgi:hypothetical protein
MAPRIRLANAQVEMAFDSQTGALVSLRNRATGDEYLPAANLSESSNVLGQTGHPVLTRFDLLGNADGHGKEGHISNPR